MPGLAQTISRLARLRDAVQPIIPTGDTRLQPLSFARNPGALDAYSFVPRGLPRGAPLVVALHGCTQSAAGYDRGTGWSRLAERAGFAVLLPEQRRENNQNRCFNWFSPADVTRNSGEVCSIATMVEAMIAEHGLDPARVFVTGLSAGGAMAAAMLATYPEMFAAGTIIAGLPYGVARSIPDAFVAMRGRSHLSPAALGSLVRNAEPDATHWPRVSIWQGTADTTVAPSNADALVAQWLDVHGLPEQPTRTDTDERQTRSVWCDGSGREVVELINVAGLGHGTPLDAAGNPDEVAGPFMLDVGISSTLHSARAWGIAGRDARAAARRAPPASKAAKPARGELNGSAAPAAAPSTARRPRGPLDVGQVINDALRSAGLLR